MQPKRKARVLKRKNIKRRTGDKAQSRQIMALSKQVSSLTKRSYVSVTTRWIRDNLSVDKIVAPTESFAYVCPLPLLLITQQVLILGQILPYLQITLAYSNMENK